MKPRLLYFTRGQIDTKKAYEIANMFPEYSVSFVDARKAKHIDSCDAVSGAVPACYLDVFSIVGETAEIDKEAFEVYTKVEAFDLPKLSDGARKLIRKHKISDNELLKVIPTGVDGIIKSDVERYVENR